MSQEERRREREIRSSEDRASSFASAPLDSALKTIGVMRPFSVATATEISATLCWRMKVSYQEELA